MVLIRFAVLGVVGLAGCGQSLFDAHGTPDGDGGDPTGVPATCPAPCIADAAADFNGTPRGAGDRWRYLDDHRDRTWAPMTASAMAMTGADPNNRITTCAAQPGAPACQALPGALLVSSAGATSAADPAIEVTSTTAQVIQLSLRAHVPGGPSGDNQLVRIYRNSREDVLFTGTAFAGTTLEQAVTLDALPGDRFLVALAPSAKGATDVGLHVFVSATGAQFPSTCQVAVPFAAAAGNTVDNLCGGDFTHSLYSGGDTPPPLAPGPFAELGTAGNITPDAYFKGTGTLNKAQDTTVQFWVKLRQLDPVYAAWLFSDLDLATDSGGGLGVAIVANPDPRLDVTTCTSGTQVTFDDAVTAYPTDGSWQFVRVVHTGGNVRVCLNGALKTSLAVSPGRLASTFSPHFGRNVVWTPAGAFFDGELDDVRVLTGALPCN